MLDRYGISGTLYMILCKIKTKLLFPNARIVRFPIDVRGKKYIDFGNNLTTGKYCRIEVFPIDKTDVSIIKFGINCQMNDSCHISAMKSVEIGDNVLMAGHIYISDNSHGHYNGDNQSSPNIEPINRSSYVAPVMIGKNVWIGEGVVIMPGVQIGEGCIIGANSVVTKSVPANSMVVGSPAKIIKQYNEKTKKWERTTI